MSDTPDASTRVRRIWGGPSSPEGHDAPDEYGSRCPAFCRINSDFDRALPLLLKALESLERIVLCDVSQQDCTRFNRALLGFAIDRDQAKLRIKPKDPLKVIEQ